MFINNPDHMTKMTAMPIYGKNPSKIIFKTAEQISTKLGMWHRGQEYYNVFVNHGPVMALIYFMYNDFIGRPCIFINILVPFL